MVHHPGARAGWGWVGSSWAGLTVQSSTGLVYAQVVQQHAVQALAPSRDGDVSGVLTAYKVLYVLRNIPSCVATRIVLDEIFV